MAVMSVEIRAGWMADMRDLWVVMMVVCWVETSAA